MGVRMSAKDLSDYGLTIIRPSDPDFDALAAEHLKDVPGEAVDSIKPLTFLIRNASRRTKSSRTWSRSGRADGTTLVTHHSWG